MKVLVVILCAVVSYTTGQPLRITDCPAPLPCLCTDRVINCDNHDKHILGPLKSSTHAFNILRISNNSLTTIGSAIFANVNITSLVMDHNSIQNIDISAFSGIQRTLTSLKLNSNQLTKLPAAIGTLSKLLDLDVSDNPIPGSTTGRVHGRLHTVDGLTDTVMRAIGDTVIKFRFGSNTSLITWPKSLRHLNKLRELTVSGSSVTYMPLDAFHGFETTLVKLKIEYANLARVPLGIQRLRNLQELHLDHLHVSPLSLFGDDSMIHAPFDNIAQSLKILTLNYDGLTVFPEELNKLVALTSLSLDGNDLEFVSDEAITLLKSSNVSSLSLRNCDLKRVPGAISNLRKLQRLDFSENHIRSIESTDLQNLFQLRELTLSQNPLKYISNNSLCGLNELRTFKLVNTSLTDISSSFKNLNNLMTLDFRESKIDCTCDLSWIKVWQEQCQGESKAEIQGQCETIDKGIQDYINIRLPTCPDYLEMSSRAGSLQCGGTCDT